MSKENKKCIVTGGCGFVGSHLVNLLVKNGHKVYVLDNFSFGTKKSLGPVYDKVKFVKCDISKDGSWKKYFKDADWVFHLAALVGIISSIQKPEEYFKLNVGGTFNVLQASKLYGAKRFIYSASSSCYENPKELPVKEKTPVNVIHPYALTKRLGEELVLHWGRIYKLPAISLRLFNVYGPRSLISGNYGDILGVFLAQKLAGKPLTVAGDGTQTRDFVHVEDVAHAFLDAAESNRVNEVYNVGSGQKTSINYIVELLKGEKVSVPKRLGEPDHIYTDITKIKKELGWSPQISIEEGIADLLRNINCWKDVPVWDPETINKRTKCWLPYFD